MGPNWEKMRFWRAGSDIT